MNKIKKIMDNIYFYFQGLKEEYEERDKDYQELLKRKNKKKKCKWKLKLNLKRDITIILIIAIVGSLFITVNNAIKYPIDLNSNKIKEIDIYNFINEDSSKKMIVDERDGIEKIVESLNSLKKDKKENQIQINNDVFRTNDTKETYMIFNIIYKNKNEIVEYYSNYIVKNDKEIYIEDNSLDSLWYILNYNIVTSQTNELINYEK